MNKEAGEDVVALINSHGGTHQQPWLCAFQALLTSNNLRRRKLVFPPHREKCFTFRNVCKLAEVTSWSVALLWSLRSDVERKVRGEAKLSSTLKPSILSTAELRLTAGVGSVHPRLPGEHLAVTHWTCSQTGTCMQSPASPTSLWRNYSE